MDLFALNKAYLNDIVTKNSYKRDWLASSVGVSRMTLNRWLSGKCTQIKRSHLFDLAKVLKCDSYNLIDRRKTNFKKILEIYGEYELLENILQVDDYSYEKIIEYYYYMAYNCFVNIPSTPSKDKMYLMGVGFADKGYKIAKRNKCNERMLKPTLNNLSTVKAWIDTIYHKNLLILVYNHLNKFFKEGRLHYLESYEP